MSSQVNIKTGWKDIMENKKNVDISIAILCYNPDLDKLKNTIVSCVKQKNITSEIIISDDGSKKQYKQELEDWAKSNKINLIYNFLESNQGTIKNLISAVKLAKSDIINAISPGDYFSKEEALAKFIKKFNEENSDIVFSNCYFYFNNKIINYRLPFFKSTLGKKQKDNICLLDDCFCAASIAFKKELVKYLENVQDYVRLTEDLSLVYQAVINNKKIGFIEENLMWYEYGSGCSCVNHNLDSDIDGLVEFLIKNYPEQSIVYKTKKRWEINKIPNKFKRQINLLFHFPNSFFKNLYRKISHKPFPKCSIEEMDKMIKL